jgi:hypothetical protein
MAIEDVTPEYVDLITYNKYTTRTSNSTEFEALKNMYSVYMNSNTNSVPDNKYTHGLALLIAHYYALDATQLPDEGQAGDDVNSGTISSESVGDVSIGYGGNIPSYENIEGWKAWLAKTGYGQEFVFLLRTYRPTPLVTG